MEKLINKVVEAIIIDKHHTSIDLAIEIGIVNIGLAVDDFTVSEKNVMKGEVMIRLENISNTQTRYRKTWKSHVNELNLLKMKLSVDDGIELTRAQSKIDNLIDKASYIVRN